MFPLLGAVAQSLPFLSMSFLGISQFLMDDYFSILAQKEGQTCLPLEYILSFKDVYKKT